MADVRVLTPPGPGGVAVLSVRGPDARARVANLVSSALPNVGELRVVRLTRESEDLDEAIVCVRSEEELELHIHGSPPLVQELAALLAGDALQGASSPSIEDRARQRAGAAQSVEGARILLDQAEGALRRSLRALTELRGVALTRELEGIVERGRRARFHFEPALVVLAGAANAGKSTLFNVLVGERRVVVSAEAGTTRDAIRVPAALGAWPIELVDTAGDRALPGEDPAGAIERAGQDLGLEARAAADLVLWLAPVAPVATVAGVRERSARLWTFGDRLDAPAADWPQDTVSAVADARGARDAVERVFRERFQLPERTWEPGSGVPFEARQRAVLLELLEQSKTGRWGDGGLERAVASLLDDAGGSRLDARGEAE